MTRSKTYGVFERGIPESFEQLCMEHLLRPIHDKAGHENALEVIHALAGLELNPDQEDYFEVLAIIVNDYEAKNMGRLPSSNGVEVLRYLTQENHISSRELSRILGKDESLGAKILSGERKITVEHAKKLADRFKIKASAFLDL
jgi:antitoxin component HigA of HigAB toxin-antitoxin module